jgi:hypothetical protein
MVAGSVHLGLYWLLAVIAFHTYWFGPLIKGGHTLLIKDGEMQTGRCDGLALLLMISHKLFVSR